MHNRRYRDLSPAMLRRAARGYPQDHKLQKFPQVFVAMKVVSEAAPVSSAPDRPAPCRIVQRASPSVASASGFRRLLLGLRTGLGTLSMQHAAPRGILLASCLFIVCRPASMRLTAKFVGLLCRLCARRLLELITLLVDQVLDEFMYSFEATSFFFDALARHLPNDRDF